MTLLARRSENYFPSLFDKLFNSDLMDWNLTNFSSTNTSLPAVNVKETKDDYIIEVAAPGMGKKDFKVNYQNNVLTISSEKEEERKEDDDNYTRREFCYQSFQRSFTVPGNNVDSDKINASYADGILTIQLPKREEIKPKPAREIKIS
ncbi:MAG: Hsp20/alpha crystallin family protein [Prolixibacteraceae bacterium]|nr:Hsp20/alpha crystallin family protein [Prolixibacteraceae bacterium]